MSTNKNRLYELIYLVNREASDEDRADIVARVKAVIDSYGKDHPSQPRWIFNQTWDPDCIISYWTKQPDNSAALSTAKPALKSWSLFAVASWPQCSDGARLVGARLTSRRLTR